MAKLGWFVAGAVVFVGTPLAYAAWGSTTSRAPAPNSVAALALEEPEATQPPLLLPASLASAPDAPLLTPAEFAPASLVERERVTDAAPAPVSRRAAGAAPAAAPPTIQASPAHRAAAAPKPQPQLASTPIASQPVSPKPPVMAAGRGASEGKDAGALMMAQVTRMKRTLRLTPEQLEQWAPVEAALREIARQYAGRRADPSRPLGGIALSEEATNRLSWAAAPLIMSLREDQKHDARQLARGMGLTQVASAF